MLRNHGSRVRRSGAAVLGFVFGMGLGLAAGCALSPIGSDHRRAPVDAADAGDHDREDPEDEEPSAPIAKRDGGPRSTAVRDASIADGSTTSAISARDAGTNQAIAPRDAATMSAPSTLVDAGRVPESSASDAAIPDTGVALFPAPSCQTGAQCIRETCPAIGLLPCCKADRTCGCRPILGACR